MRRLFVLRGVCFVNNKDGLLKQITIKDLTLSEFWLEFSIQYVFIFYNFSWNYERYLRLRKTYVQSCYFK